MSFKGQHLNIPGNTPVLKALLSIIKSERETGKNKQQKDESLKKRGYYNPAVKEGFIKVNRLLVILG